MTEGTGGGVAELLERARASGMELWTEGTRLRFRAPPGGLTEEVRDALRSRKDEVMAALQAEAAASVVSRPMAVNQKGLWLIHQLAPDNAAYNVAFAARILGELDFTLLEEAFQVLVDRHEALRTSYGVGENGELEQRVLGRIPFRLQLGDMSAREEGEVRAFLRASYLEPFRLHEPPLLRAHLVRTAAEEHVLMVVAHHLAIDGQSLFLILGELFEVYGALVEGEALAPRGDAAEFGEFVEWQHRTLALDPPSAAYWEGVLDPPPEPLDIPTDRPSTGAPSLSGGTVHFRIDGETARPLRELAQVYGTTDYILLVALWSAYLHRLTGATDVVVGTPVHGRPSVRFERTVGDFVNLLPLRFRLSSDDTLDALLEHAREVVIEGMAHQDYPFPLMTGGRSSGRGGAPFETLFVLQDFKRFGELDAFMFAEPGQAIQFGALTLAPFPIDQQEGQFPLALDAWRDRVGWTCTCKYDGALFDAETVERRMAGFVTFLQDAAARSGTTLGDLEIMSPEERGLLAEWNRTEVEYERDVTLVDLVLAQIGRTAERVAVEAPDSTTIREITYRELEQRSGVLAERLQALGVGRDVRVAVVMERSVELVVALVAVLRAGGAYVPVDPDYPEQRKSFMLEDCGALVVLTQSSLVDGLRERGIAEPVAVDLLWPELDSDLRPSPVADAGTLAYVIYTSGSTGTPKGAMVEHRAIVNRLLWTQQHFRMDRTDVVLQKTPYSFDVSVWEFFWPLMVGARLVMARPDGHKDPEYLADVIAREGITTVHFVPSMLSLFLEGLDSGALGTLRRVICSGEALSPALRDRFFKTVPGVELTNLYGPTEAAVDVSWWRCSPEDSPVRVPIGCPVANTRLYVLDDRMRQVPIGVRGELCIGGVQVGRGYLGRTELTAERFPSSPFEGGGRIYRTGDQARFLRDGAIDYLGRLDHQVKVRGFRVEPGEIEARLREHPGVEDVVVVARDDRLVAYVVARGEGPPPATEQLRDWMARTLPSHMIPSLLVPLESLSLTPSGKLDRRALPEPEGSPHRTGRREPPETGTERELANIWEDVLGVDRVGRNDDFFRLGGHSLLVPPVVMAVRERFEVELPMGALFQGPVLSDLARRVEELLVTALSGSSGGPDGADDVWVF